MYALKAMSRTGFLEMLLLEAGLWRPSPSEWAMRSPPNPDRVSKVLGSVIGLLLARGLGGVWQVYRATRSGQTPEGA